MRQYHVGRVPELIDTCWNVNQQLFKFSLAIESDFDIVKELIDTCWNVNPSTPIVDIIPFSELIDTCWNVNYELIESDFDIVRINRYMLECKSSGVEFRCSYLLRINRYMLECKF